MSGRRSGATPLTAGARRFRRALPFRTSGRLAHASTPLARLGRAARAFWRLLRQWSGDAAYDTYAARVAEGERLSPQAFYLDALRRRYRRPNRCC